MPARREGRAPPTRGGGLRAAGLAASRLAAPIIARHGGGILASLKAQWAAAVGADITAASWPEALARGGVLKLRVAPPGALELQHQAPLVIDRINLYFGRAVVTRLAFVQGPLPRASAPRRPPPGPLDVAEAEALDRALAAITDPALREALSGLGQAVLASEAGKG